MLGLGLAVVARIVEQLGGRLRVHSDVGKGSRFSFLIPLTVSGEGGSGSRYIPRVAPNFCSIEPGPALPT